MRKLGIVVAVVTLAAACAKGSASLEIKPGHTVSVEKKDGVVVVGRLVEVQPEHVVVDTSTGRKEIARVDISAFRADASAVSVPAQATGTALAAERSETSAAATPAASAAAPVPEYREVTLPAGTVLPVELTTAVASDSSQVEDAVRGRLRRAITVQGVQAFPAGTAVSGVVTAADRSARVKGRAHVAFRFTAIDPPGP